LAGDGNFKKNEKRKTMKATPYTINDITEETYCDSCGAPLFVGDRAYPSTDETSVFCCATERRAHELAN
jgi:hypothetical protein